MHYFKRNIGDYAKKAGKLSMIEHGAYTLLIDACYDREQFPTLEQAIDWCWARSDDEKQAVEFVLCKFFTLEDGKYVQNRIREEIEEYKQKSITNKRIALEREEKRRNNSTYRAPVVNDTTPNHKPITINHKPKDIQPEGFDLFWNAYGYKTGKPNSIKEWVKIKPDSPLIEKICKQAEKDKKAKPDNKYRKHPERWLKYRGWEDEIVSHETVAKELPLGTDAQIERAYREECGGDPSRARFNSYAEMRKFVQDFRDKKIR